MKGNHLEPTRVADNGITKLIERLGQDCGPSQFIREFCYNSIEAIKRTKKNGEIHLDVDWNMYEEQNGVYKLSITDNGDGMTGEEMVTLMKDLSSSGPANDYENYGMGAKISALTRNKAGITYQSWKNGDGCMIILRYDQRGDMYGCVRWEDGSGEYRSWVKISDELKPEIIKDHGTKVILWGNSVDEDTMKKPEGIKSSDESWIYRCINDRFWTIPEGVTIKVRIG